MSLIFSSKMQKSLVWNFLMILRLISLSINYHLRYSLIEGELDNGSIFHEYLLKN